MARTVVLSAPAGSGKTHNKEALRKHFGCDTVIDEWYAGQPIKSGALHLTMANAKAVAFEAGKYGAEFVIVLDPQSLLKG